MEELVCATARQSSQRRLNRWPAELRRSRRGRLRRPHCILPPSRVTWSEPTAPLQAVWIGGSIPVRSTVYPRPPLVLGRGIGWIVRRYRAMGCRSGGHVAGFSFLLCFGWLDLQGLLLFLLVVGSAHLDGGDQAEERTWSTCVAGKRTLV